MADNSSEGSDIEEGIDAEYQVQADVLADGLEEDDLDRLVLPSDRVVREQWIQAMFGEEEGDLCEFAGFGNEWKSDNFHSREKIPFNREPGIKIELPLPDVITPVQVFSRIFTEDMWMRLVTQTNLYAEQTRSATPSNSKWEPVTIVEMKTFVGLCLAMGIIELPLRRDFWRQKKWLFRTTIPQAMSRDRFAIIWRYLHLQDNDAIDVDRTDKLWKVRWYLDYLKDRFQELYEVNGFVSVDESMVKFKGRLSFRQYLPLKPTKWGIKVWVMAESSTGYVSNFQVYTGRKAGGSEKGLAHRVVMDLARPYFGSHLSIYMDNFYSGVPLFEDLSAHGLDACGTIRSNRKGIPTKLAAMARHQYTVRQKDDLTFCAWQDTKAVLVLSNHHAPTATGTVKRRQGGDVQTEVTVPACLSDYQRNMKGVDLLDQMVGYYTIKHRSKKWWRRLFFYFLSVSCYNAYIVAKRAGANFSGYKDWQEDLAQELVTPVTARSAPQCATAPVSASAQHDCEKIFEKRKICRECSLAKNGTDARPGATIYGCRQCNVPLHVECFGKHVRRT
ncbi:piggyBac transposable element-derived protein 4-like [Eleginops maclovinus]|uniref:piggyBac transposable element-derived protein 4-like n=1 Tax=Eleginops maclovinus TaxID=56733 RepID=UPI003080DDF0